MHNLSFSEFKKNVYRWSLDRGIFDQSSEIAQKSKAIEELAELVVAKNEEEKKDAIGDIAVCIVNAAFFKKERLTFGPGFNCISTMAGNLVEGSYRNAMNDLRSFTRKEGLDFDECITIAWQEIKDRKGSMINGKFVKD